MTTPPREAASAEPWPWPSAVGWLSLLGPLFFLTYGLANWAAAQRTQVPSIAFAWESRVPFWPWTIVPYWSIDALYGISLFLCLTRLELSTHVRRLLTAQVIAVSCFILFPLRFSFGLPAVNGAFAFFFDALRSFDRPFNQLPSLHVALAVILRALYARRLSGMARLAMDAWFLVIVASALTTWQHHFIDIPTGTVLGLLCLWAWPFENESDGRFIGVHWHRTDDPARPRLTLWYASGAVALGVMALLVGGWALWLLWGSLALILVALAYAGLGVAAFQKSADGRLSTAARWLFAPYLAGAWLNSRAWTWRRGRPSAVTDDVFVGRVPTSRELARLPFAGIVDVTAEFDVHPGNRKIAVVPVLDLTLPSADTLAKSAEAIERLRAEGSVLVCCALGYSRSASAVAAWLLATGRAPSAPAALDRVRAARRGVVFKPGHLVALDRIATWRPDHSNHSNRGGAAAAG